MTNEEVMNIFKEKGIEVTIYETPYHTIENVIIDTYEHDKQIIAEVIEEYKNKIEFEQKWLLDCKVFNPDVAIAFETLKSYSEQLKEK